LRIAAAILAAGSAQRFGRDKTTLPINQKPVWQWSFEVFSKIESIDAVYVVVSENNRADVESRVGPDAVVLGGSSRQESTHHAVNRAKRDGFDAVLLHDAARPFVTPEVIERVLAGVESGKNCAPAVPLADTVKRVSEESQNDRVSETPARSTLRAVQTPQGVIVDDYLKAIAHDATEGTDDLSVLERAGFTTYLVAGDPANFKLTTPADLDRLSHRATLDRPPIMVRTGFGYDVHRFSDDPERTLYLGGLEFPGEQALDGHSDADVILHALTDAILGALALGDIGQHFPNTDPQWSGASSDRFLDHACKLMTEKGWSISNLDIAVVAEKPKIMKRSEEMRARLAGLCGVEPNQVSVKATTNEKLGFVGREEGIAATAVATLFKTA
jgi:2-C-methyl-D-erythritol 4-phosphate cytidylyltransferase/2-C-methyl-D-erythritol 2,4-cyclodiphosphate synthase